MSRGLPPKQGLYDPQNEKDSCGVGFVVNAKGVKSHRIVAQALEVLDNLAHRGACGCEANTGDGAGILIQIPDKFYRARSAELGIKLPPLGRYGTGVFFLPTDPGQRAACEAVLERVTAEEGQAFLGWRDIPADNAEIGHSAKRSEPKFRQAFIGASDAIKDQDAFERKLFVIRKRTEIGVAAAGIHNHQVFYVCSLSSRTVVYKGMLDAGQLDTFFPDVLDPEVESAMALVHSRFSTNTFPSWDRAHPYRFIAHNGEINTLRGNINWMRAREALLAGGALGEDIRKILPVIDEDGSDSAMFDNVLELLVLSGRSLPHAVMMLIPEPWQQHESMSPAKRAFYEYHSCLMEPWDGPASIVFTDGRVIGAVLDRNGLRPSRYYVTKDDLVVMASEVGVLPDIPPENVLSKGRLQPGRMFLIDTEQGRIVDDNELKEQIAKQQPYAQWLKDNLIAIEDLPEPAHVHEPDHDTVLHRQLAFGYTQEDLRILMEPMAVNGEEAIGSMGTDTPLAVLSDKPQLLYSYFKQLFAQVTNPPLDAIREELVTSVGTSIGPEGNLLEPTPRSARQIKLKSAVLSNEDLEKLRHIKRGGFKAITLPMLFPRNAGADGMLKALQELCAAASRAHLDGCDLVILSDRGVDAVNAPIPALLATAGVHHHLIREGTRGRVGLIIETGEPREVHHFALLLGYGAGAVNPYLAFETFDDLIRRKVLPASIDHKTAVKHFIKAVNKGTLKVISKMGISTIQSYRGAQIFEAVGLNKDVVDRWFTHTATRIGGIGLEGIAQETLSRHHKAYPERPVAGVPDLDSGGQYQFRRDGEYHLFNPETVHKLQHAVRSSNYKVFKEYSTLIDNQSRRICTLRGLFDFKFDRPAVPIEEVEPASEIVKRFATGAMSFGSISQEAHETLAIAMNRIGGRSNTGEGGEDPARFLRDPNGDWRRSAIKQVASGRFGVTSSYLVNSEELQIKMAQGAKPGEGGQLPGKKVYPWIAKVRHSTPGVGLISPPPHHDIYSIEDLAQLIHDLKNSNPRARISVKLVAEVGVGTVAAGVAKAHSDVVLIAGYDGGTGASPLTSIKHAGIPWELGLSETHQVLVMNDLRSRIVVQTDGQLKTGRDVVVAALLGAEEFGFATAALVAEGCIMMRVCHMDTCPVGVATQNPELRKKFAGKPEHVVNFMMYMAEEVRELMAKLGYRKIEEMVGQVQRLDVVKAISHWKAKGLDFSAVFHKPVGNPESTVYCSTSQDHGLDKALDKTLIRLAEPALEHGRPVELRRPIRNINRTVGTMLGSEVTRRWGAAGLPTDTIRIHFDGSAGQSFGAFVPHGMSLTLEGDANDYCGKGLSGGRIVVHPPRTVTFVPETNMIVGNVTLYGATSGEAYFRGMAGERFAVRNSGAHAVVESVGDHGCEYMTGGCVVILGATGRNFAAGMSGGSAFVLDEAGDFPVRCNKEMVELEPLVDAEDVDLVKGLIAKHAEFTGSTRAKWVLENFATLQSKFRKVMPIDYKRVLLERKRQSLEAAAGAAAGA